MTQPKIKILSPEFTGQRHDDERPRIILPKSVAAMPKINFQPESRPRVENIVPKIPINFEGRQINFYHQANGSDCGPAMCLNIQELFGAEPPVDSIDGEEIDSVRGVRRWLTDHWAGSLRVGDPAEKWFTSSDVARYLIDGLGLEGGDMNNVYDLDRTLAREGRKFIWGYSDMHFKGFYQNEEGEVYDIDSLSMAPLLSNESALRQYADRTFNSPDVARRGLHSVFARVTGTSSDLG